MSVLLTVGVVCLAGMVVFTISVFLTKDIEDENTKAFLVIVWPFVIFFGIATFIGDGMKFVDLVPYVETRPETLEIIELDYNNDTVILSDANGYRYFMEGIEDWHKGDLVSCIMDTKFTDIILDDEIMEARFSGYSVNR